MNDSYKAGAANAQVAKSNWNSPEDFHRAKVRAERWLKSSLNLWKSDGTFKRRIPHRDAKPPGHIAVFFVNPENKKLKKRG